MSEGSEVQSAKTQKGLIACFIGPLVLLLVYGVLGWFDKTTELTPSHDRILQSCFLIAGLAGLLCGGLSIRESRGWLAWHRVIIACCVVMLGFLAVLLVTYRSTGIIEAFIDFPPTKTKTYSGLLVIWRAHRTPGKETICNIQTTPIWSNLYVTETDYDFMLAHRSTMHHGRDPDEISSHGFFCARVTLQQSGNALRIMNAGSQKLPKGTVVICPTTPPIASPDQ